MTDFNDIVLKIKDSGKTLEICVIDNKTYCDNTEIRLKKISLNKGTWFDD
jgi:hypothetical protein